MLSNNKKIDKVFEFHNRSCDALVLAYNTNFALSKNFGRNFYIPSSSNVEEAFGHSLRKILGVKAGCSHWADAVKWPCISNLEKLEKRIREGVFEVVSGDSDYQTIFEDYFSSFSQRFEHNWVYMKGDLYRFADGRREEAFRKFEGFWNEKEKIRWKQIHEFMRAYSIKQYKEKESIN